MSELTQGSVGVGVLIVDEPGSGKQWEAYFPDDGASPWQSMLEITSELDDLDVLARARATDDALTDKDHRLLLIYVHWSALTGDEAARIETMRKFGKICGAVSPPIFCTFLVVAEGLNVDSPDIADVAYYINFLRHNFPSNGRLTSVATRHRELFEVELVAPLAKLIGGGAVDAAAVGATLAAFEERLGAGPAAESKDAEEARKRCYQFYLLLNTVCTQVDEEAARPVAPDGRGLVSDPLWSKLLPSVISDLTQGGNLGRETMATLRTLADCAAKPAPDSRLAFDGLFNAFLTNRLERKAVLAELYRLGRQQ